MAYPSKLKEPMIDELFQAILALQDSDECYRFFEDLCTVGELKAMAQRWKVAHMLAHQRTYTDIIQETGASTATISRIKRCLYYGADGYRDLIARLANEELATADALQAVSAGQATAKKNENQEK